MSEWYNDDECCWIEGYVEETLHFARRIGAKKIGIATCIGLLQESPTLAKVLVVKDRVTGRNPTAALYLSHFCYRKVFSV